MTDDVAALACSVRPGSMLDVNPVARLLHDSARPIDVDGDGIPDGPMDEESAGIAARLMLLHVVLESGRLVVGERDGRVVAAAIWLPGDAVAATGDIQDVLRRELHLDSSDDLAHTLGPNEPAREAFEESMGDLVDGITQTSAEMVLYAVVVDRSVLSDEVVPMARAVIAPVVREGRPVLGLAIDPDRARLLEAVGFRERTRVQVGARNTLWIGAPGRPITA